MKNMKRVLAALLSVAMLLAMAVPAFAEGEGASAANTYTISVKSGDTHTYEVYQIFTGDLKDKTLSNVKWGTNGTGTAGEAVADDVLTALQKLENNTQATATAVAEYVNFKSNAVATVSSGSNATVAAGYYLLKDVTTTLPEGESYSTYIVQVVKNTEVESKTGKVTFEKKVQDINDSTDSTYGNWQDSADHDVGDAVPFKLTGTLPENYASYTTYYYQFSDQMEPSLTFNSSSVMVKIDGVAVESTAYKLETGKASTSDSFNGGDSFTVTFNNLKTTTAKANSTITVEYTATLNEKAVLGEQGNVNEAKLIYSNNPNKSGEGDNEHGETPWDQVIVFTYKVEVNKVDSEKKPLTGAEFTLYKKLANNTEKEIKAVTATSGASFSFSGLDDGTYVLKETKTPDGYNTAADLTFKVTATHSETWNGTSRTEVLTTLNGNEVDGEITLTNSKKDGTLSTDIVNKKGAELPSTGGIGTTIFYVVGGCMMFGAAVLLITKKRMENQ